MTAVIYDYKNNPVEVELPDKRITEIAVLVLTGDEVVKFTFEDGTTVEADSSNSRFAIFWDGDYTVTGEKNIAKWLGFKCTDGRTISYKRCDAANEGRFNEDT